MRIRRPDRGVYPASDQHDAICKATDATTPPVVGDGCDADDVANPDVAEQVDNALSMRSLSLTFRVMLLGAAVVVLAAVLGDLPVATAVFLAALFIMLAVIARMFYRRLLNQARSAGHVMYLPGMVRGRLIRIGADGQTIRIR